MVIFSLFSWWYTTGWFTLMQKCGARLQGTLRFFSVSQLLGSLFAPFRQISAGRVRGPLNVQLQAFGDRLFSRFMGAIVRLILIVIGMISMLVLAIACVVVIAVWPLMPVAPVIGLLFAGKGV